MIEHRQLTRAGHRYVLIEPDGSLGQSLGYEQRPVALRNARDGLGVYDTRTREVILAPDPRQRLAALDRSLDLRRGQVRYLEGKIRDIEDCQPVRVGETGG